MSMLKTYTSLAASVAILIGAGAAVDTAAATPLSQAGVRTADASGTVQDVRYRRWGGVGIYIGPSYGYYPRYGDGGYYSDYGYYPRYRSSYYGDRYDRGYPKYSRRWTKERFEHPLGRR